MNGSTRRRIASFLIFSITLAFAVAARDIKQDVEASLPEAELKQQLGGASSQSAALSSSSSSSSSWYSRLVGEETGVRFFSGFIASTSMILVSEFGDKTFFIAAIMAMRHPRLEVFGSAIFALALMTVLSAAMGFTLPNILSPRLTHGLSSLLFLFFGVRLLYDAYFMAPHVANLEELEEVEEELEKTEMETLNPSSLEKGEDDSQRKTLSRSTALFRRCFSPIFIQCFTMTFLAEWGDRSQIATIALAAAKDPIGVTLGGICGHAACTGVAVLGGKLLATRISERTIAITGGVLFLIFAIHSIFFDV